MKLWVKVVIGLVLGVFFGLAMGQITEAKNGWSGTKFLIDYILPIGTLFIHLIKMVVVPLIFFAITSGIVSMTDAKAFKRIGLKSVFAYLITAMFAVCIGLFFGSVFEPGLGVDTEQLKQLNTSANVAPPSSAPHVDNTKPPAKIVIDLLVEMVPTNAISAMAEDHILQVVVFAIFVAITMNALRERVQPLIEIVHSCAFVVFKLIETVIKFAPYGVFAFTSTVVASQGKDILYALLELVLVVLGAMVVQYVLFGVIIAVFGRMSPFPFYKKMMEPQTLAFSTSSSKATLSTAMRVMNERMGVSKTSTSFVLPLGASINMDGTAIYLGICALFFSQAYGIELHGHQYLLIILTSTLASIGAAGIPGGSLIMMGMVLTSVGIPLEGIALIAGVDRVLDMVRTTVNITGDCCITLVVDRSEDTLDMKKYKADI